MRIAMIGCRGIPAHVGGAEQVVEQLTIELSALGHEVIVYGRGHYVRPGQQPPAGRVIITPGLRGKHAEAFTHTATAMLDALHREVDVVHVHSPGPAMLSWIPAAARRPVVLTVHAPDWRREKWSRPARWMLRGGLGCGMRLARAVTAVSKPLAEELARLYNRPVVYIPNAARTVEPRRASAITGWGLRPEEYGLYVGRIVPEKRLDLLLAAWARAGAPHRLVVAGDFGENGYARRCARRAPDGVVLVGPQRGPVLAELYSNAALVVLPSVLEGMSLVLLEAAAYGRCILAADIPANTDAMGDSILYFPQDDARQLAEQIGRCLEEPKLRNELGMKARAFVRERYSWRSAAEQMERVYRRAAAG